MENHKIISLLDDTRNPLCEYRARNWVEINDELGGTHNVNNPFKFKTLMVRSHLSDYNDTYIHTC